MLLEVTSQIPTRRGRRIDIVDDLQWNVVISVLLSNFSISENHPYEIFWDPVSFVASSEVDCLGSTGIVPKSSPESSL